MQFCKAKPNLLAVGGSEVFIINVEQGLHERDQSKYTFKPGKNP